MTQQLQCRLSLNNQLHMLTTILTANCGYGPYSAKKRKQD